MKRTISFIIMILFAFVQLHAQVHYQNTTTNNTNSSAIGYGTIASGEKSFASGLTSTAEGVGSTTMGIDNLAIGHYSITLGSNLKALQDHAIVIGSGNSNYFRLTNNNTYSLMIGFKSQYPTMFVSTSPTYDKTGKIGIGNVTNPQAKLHLRADDGEKATVFIEPNNWSAGEKAGLALGNLNHGITAKSSIGLQFHTQLYYTFNEGNVGIGTDKPTYTLHVIGSTFTNMFTLFDEHNPPQNGMVLVSDEAGNANWADPANVSLWKINPNNGVDLYFPEGVEGNVGIGTINTYGYRLAVNGKILTDEVMVKDPVNWFDYVLKPGYKLMPLNELEIFINQNSHLPDVPSEAEVAEDGYGLAEMNGILLKKVEELTLYIIEQKKAIEEQQDEIKKMKEFIGIRNN